MEYTLEKGSWENISDAVQVEEETLPNSCYLRDNSAYFLNDTVGDLTMVRAGDEPVGLESCRYCRMGPAGWRLSGYVPHGRDVALGKPFTPAGWKRHNR